MDLFLCNYIRFSILLNDLPTAFFNCFRGLWQSNTLPFILVMEVLTIMLRSKDGRFISDFEVGIDTNNKFMVSHLPFANDTSLLCDANME